GSARAEPLTAFLDESPTLPWWHQRPELVQPFGTGGIPGRGERGGSLRRHLCALVDLAFVHIRGREVSQEHQGVGSVESVRDHRQVVEGIVYRYRTGVAW